MRQPCPCPLPLAHPLSRSIRVQSALLLFGALFLSFLASVSPTCRLLCLHICNCTFARCAAQVVELTITNSLAVINRFRGQAKEDMEGKGKARWEADPGRPVAHYEPMSTRYGEYMFIYIIKHRAADTPLKREPTGDTTNRQTTQLHNSTTTTVQSPHTATRHMTHASHTPNAQPPRPPSTLS